MGSCSNFLARLLAPTRNVSSQPDVQRARCSQRLAFGSIRQPAWLPIPQITFRSGARTEGFVPSALR